MKSRSALTIARVIARLNIGGPAMQAILLTEAFRQKGYRSLLLTGELSPGEGSMEYLARDREVAPIKIGGMSRRICWYDDLIALWKLLRIFRREKPAILHTHTAKAGALGRLAAICSGVPIRIHTFHGHVFRGYFSPVITRFFLAIERFLARFTDCIIAISESQKRELVQVYRIAPAEKVAVIPLGIELDPFLKVEGRDEELRHAIGCEEDSLLVGWVGRLTAIKDPELFLAASRRLLCEWRNVRLVLVGDGELRQRCQMLFPAANIAGWRRHLEKVYSDMDLVVSSSVNEGTPVSLLEAMASGRAFVSTDVGGVRDLMVGEGKKQWDGFEVFENGILVPRDAVVLAHAISYLIRNPRLRHAMGQVGRRFVRTRFSVERLADDLESLYLSLARSKRILPLEAEPLIAVNSTQSAECASIREGPP
jgi:glycosyltransferase involved in cell wall biosynthesis